MTQLPASRCRGPSSESPQEFAEKPIAVWQVVAEDHNFDGSLIGRAWRGDTERGAVATLGPQAGGGFYITVSVPSATATFEILAREATERGAREIGEACLELAELLQDAAGAGKWAELLRHLPALRQLLFGDTHAQ